jgi:putative phosphoribosyl transferase
MAPLFPVRETLAIPVADATLAGDLTVPSGATGIVVFAHGSGSGRHSPRNRMVAGALADARLATLLFDLLTEQEERLDAPSGYLRFDVGLLARRVQGALEWLAGVGAAGSLPVGLFGASTGGAAALTAAANLPERVAAVVSRGGRPDLAGDALPFVRAPTLLIVGGDDTEVLALNERARARMSAPVRLEVIPGASHLFAEPGALERVAELARAHFVAALSGWGSRSGPPR